MDWHHILSLITNKYAFNFLEDHWKCNLCQSPKVSYTSRWPNDGDTRERAVIYDTLLTIDFNLKSHIGRVDWTTRNLGDVRGENKRKWLWFENVSRSNIQNPHTKEHARKRWWAINPPYELARNGLRFEILRVIKIFCRINWDLHTFLKNIFDARWGNWDV